MAKRRTIWLALAAVAWASRPAAAAESLARAEPMCPPPNFAVQTWRVEEGLPHNSVQALCQTRDGYLWVGTRFGLARFDGVRFQAFTRSRTPSTVDDNHVALAEALDGGLWVGTYDGLLRFRQGQFTLEPGIGKRRVWAVLAREDGTLWLGLDAGLGRWRKGELRVFAPAAEGSLTNRVRGLLADPDGKLIVTTVPGWFRFDPATEHFSPWLVPVATSQSRELARTAGMAGTTMWSELESLPWDAARLAEHVFRNAANRPLWGPRLHRDESGVWWMTDTERRLYRADGTGVTRVGSRYEDGIDEQVLCVLKDREGNVWLGTAIGGLKRLRRATFQTFLPDRAVLEDEDIRAACLGGDGAIWAGTRSGLLRVFGGQATTTLPMAISAGRLTTLWPDGAGGLWLGYSRQGLLRLRDGMVDDYTERAGLSRDRVMTIFQDRGGKLWIGTTNGLVRHAAGQTRRFGRAEGLDSLNVRAVHEDRDGRVWIATLGGVGRLEGERFRTFTGRDGLAGDVTWGFLEEPDGSLWIIGQYGLTRFRENRFATVTARQGLFDDLNNQMFEDDLGNFWFGCNRGIYRVRREELHAVADGRRASVSCIVYGTADGMLSAETNGETQPAGAKAPDGSLWFPTTMGLVRVEPAAAQANEVPPIVLVEELRAGDRVIHSDHGAGSAPLRHVPAVIEAGGGRVVEIHYTANSLAAPEQVRFKYRLAGHDPDWIEAGARRVAFYTNLRPREYRFEVLACNNHGLWAQTPVTLAFVLRPHFYQRPIFYAACVLVAALGVLGGHRLRVRAMRRRLALEGQLSLALERARIAKDMHDDVGSSLTQIGLLSERALRAAGLEQARATVQRVADAARETSHAMEEIVWAMNPKNDRLDNLANYICQFAREYLEPTGIVCRLDVPTLLPELPVPSETRHHLLLVLKEALNNVVKHSGASEVVVKLALTGTRLQMTVADNGRGPALSSATPSASGAGGNGLPNMRRRLDSLGGQLVVDAAAGKGMRIEAVVPIAGGAMKR